MAKQRPCPATPEAAGNDGADEQARLGRLNCCCVFVLRHSGGADAEAGSAGTWSRDTSLLWLTMMTCAVVWCVGWLMEGVGMLRVLGETRVHSVCTLRRENQLKHLNNLLLLSNRRRVMEWGTGPMDDSDEG